MDKDNTLSAASDPPTSNVNSVKSLPAPITQNAQQNKIAIGKIQSFVTMLLRQTGLKIVFHFLKFSKYTTDATKRHILSCLLGKFPRQYLLYKNYIVEV